MRQLTVRGFGKDLESRIRALAKREGISLNKAAMRLLRRGAGLEDRDANGTRVGTALDHVIGTWTAAEAREFDKAVRDLEGIESSLWE